MNTTRSVSSEFPYKSKYIRVLGSKMHYVDSGRGDPILFLHGMPTSSYLWRNIIPELSKKAHCIAVDLIGMGKSDKPDITYGIFDHIKYIEGFIKALKLKNLTLVLHGWGSVIGLHYASQNEKQIKGIAFYESYIGPMSGWENLSLPAQHLVTLLRNPETRYQTVMMDDDLINKIFHSASIRKLTTTELKYYRQPFLKLEDRKVLWQFVQESPVGQCSQQVMQIIQNYSTYLETSPTPKLMLYTIPGFITTVSTIEWCRQHLPNLTIADLGEGLHFVQEYNPKAFSKALSKWYSTLNNKSSNIKKRKKVSA